MGVPDFNGQRHELMAYFGEYAEDYNAATMPHARYYDYDKSEMEEYAWKKRKVEPGHSLLIQVEMTEGLGWSERSRKKLRDVRQQSNGVVNYALI